MASFLLDNITKANQTLYTKKDHVSPFCFKITLEQLDKEKERRENIKRMLNQMEILQEHMQGRGEVFRVEEVFLMVICDRRRIKIGTTEGLRRVLTLAINNRVVIKVLTP